MFLMFFKSLPGSNCLGHIVIPALHNGFSQLQISSKFSLQIHHIKQGGNNFQKTSIRRLPIRPFQTSHQEMQHFSRLGTVLVQQITGVSFSSSFQLSLVQPVSIMSAYAGLRIWPPLTYRLGHFSGFNMDLALRAMKEIFLAFLSGIMDQMVAVVLNGVPPPLPACGRFMAAYHLST